MPKFLAVHTLTAPTTVEDVSVLAKQVKANHTVDAYWVRSWAQSDEEGKVVKIYCQWDAADAESISKVLTKVPDLPVDGTYPMMIIHSEDFR